MTDADFPPPPEDELTRLRTQNDALRAQLDAEQQAARKTLLHAEMKAEALRAGMVDLDGLKLLAPDAVSVDEDGRVIGAETAMMQLRRDKPWLFHAASSSSAAHVPPASVAKPKQATEMTLEEWRSARADLLRRR